MRIRLAAVATAVALCVGCNDAKPTVNLIIEPTNADPLNYCNDLGGSLRKNMTTQIITCEGVNPDALERLKENKP